MAARSNWKTTKGVPALTDLGMTTLEATLYCELVEGGPTTGYGLSKAINKPVANVYKALYTLEQKGAILVEEGETRTCTAVAPKEWLARLDREFKERRKLASAALSRAKPSAEDENVYRLSSAPQVVERALTMIRGARKHLIIDAFPAPLERIRTAIETAAGRGVAVLVEAYEPVEIAGCEIVLHPGRKDILPNWPGDALMVSSDGLEFLQALFDASGDGVVRATWTANVFLACQSHIAGVNNVVLSGLMNQLAGGASAPTLKRAVKRFDGFRLRHVRGFAKLQKFAGTPK